ncbi:unnamed protein product, partial [marine sediment metagenome]
TAEIGRAMVAKFGETHNMAGRIRILQRICSPYEHNLTLLGWALRTYVEHLQVDEERICQILKAWLVTGLKTEYGIEDASNALFPICILSKYDVPVKKRFLTREFNVDESNLNLLTEIGIIEEHDDEFVDISSYTMRRLLLELIASESSLATKVKDHLKGMEATVGQEESLLLLYILKCPEMSHIVLGHLESRADLCRSLLSNKQVQSEVATNLPKEQNLRRIADCIYMLSQADIATAKEILKTIPMESLEVKIRKKENVA